MRKLLLAVVALGGLTALSATGAMAQPYEGHSHMQVEHRADRHVDYDHGHHHHHHRRWEHGHWHYWN